MKGLDLTTVGANYSDCAEKATTLAGKFFMVPVDEIALNLEHAEFHRADYSFNGEIKYADFTTQFTAYVQDAKEEQ